MALLELTEETGIKTIREFHGTLLKLLDANEEITLDFSRVGRIDLALAQVLIAAQKTARNENKIIKLKKVSPELRQQLVIAGLVK